MSDTLQPLSRTDMALRVPLAGVQQIEASAGTGKTYTIAGLYVRLIVERKLHVRDVLVMTFTKAATEELRQRLRQRLRQCAQVAAEPAWLEADAPVPDALDDTGHWALALLRRALDKGDESAEQLRQRLDAAVQGMDEAAIFTIHGFCQRVLREHAALIENVSGDVALEPGDDDLLKEFAADAWLRLAAHDDAATRVALLKFGSDPEALAKTLKSLVDFDGRIEPARAESDARPPDHAALRDEVMRAWREDGDAALAVFEQVRATKQISLSKYNKNTPDKLRELQQQLSNGVWPEKTLLEKFSASRLSEASADSGHRFPGHRAFDAIDAWLAAEPETTAHVLQMLIRDARDWLRTRKRELARMSYADQIEWVHAGLDDSTRGRTLRDALRRQFPVALVDEFQDTDARQFEIFASLYADHGTLFAIGDPKQSIYGFRGADVQAYLRARELAGDRAHRLDRNFRSAPGLLTACAALFGGREDVFVEDGIKFEPVQPGGRVEDGVLCVQGQPATPMTVWPLPDELASANKATAEAALATACASEIARLLAPDAATLSGDPLRPGNIAVLVDSNTQAMQVQDALAALGVPAVCQRRESIYSSHEAIELRQIMGALLAPRHAGLARGALATHLLGRRLSDLVAMRDEDADWRTELDDLRAHWLERGVLAMIERLGERHAARLLAEPGGERCMSNLLQLADALQAESRRLSGARAQRDWLARRMALADKNNEEEQLRLESDAERVQIMTLHASKGLEFDLVFLPFAAWMQATDAAKGKFARFHEGNDLVQRFIATGSDARDPADRIALEKARHEALAEGVRKLYVGVTRARYACWLSFGAKIKKSSDGVLDWVLHEGLQPVLQRAEGRVVTRDLPSGKVPRRQYESNAEPGSARRFTRALDRDWRSHSFSRLAEGEHPAPDPSTMTEPGQGERLPALAGLRGSRFGSAVHDALEYADFAAWATDPVPEAQRRIVARALAAQGLSGPAAEQAVTDLIATSLRTSMLDDLSLAALQPTQYRAEMEFHFGIAGVDPGALLALLHQHGYQTQRQSFAHAGVRLAGLMTGIIDLVFVHEGRWWIADYKTNHLGDHAGDYAPARLAEAVRASDYDLQYIIYTVALHRWLRQVRGADYDYERDVGGVRYLFLRGMGVGGAGNGIHADRLPAQLIEIVDHLLHAPGADA